MLKAAQAKLTNNPLLLLALIYYDFLLSAAAAEDSFRGVAANFQPLGARKVCCIPRFQAEKLTLADALIHSASR
jgi:hypothetical protein